MSLFRRFSKLHWKLAFSYVGVTLLTVLTLEAVASLAVILLFAGPVGDTLAGKSTLAGARRIAEQVAEPLQTGSAAELGAALEELRGTAVVFQIVEGTSAEAARGRWLTLPVIVIGLEGHVVTSNEPGFYRPGESFSEPGLPEAERLVAAVLEGAAAEARVLSEPPVSIAAVPITGSGGERLGVLYHRQPTLLSPATLAELAQTLLATAIVTMPCLVPLGLLFGFLTARSLTRRLRRLADASSALEEGDLSRRVSDASADEIGQLARQFDRMAARIEADTSHLQELAESNARLARQAQRLAALEERNRLARDLHDGVKQHLFGVNLAAAAALNELDSDAEAARARLAEAVHHSESAQAEMQALLEELRPAGLDDRGLTAALADYLANFENRESLTVDWQPPETPDLDIPLRHQQAVFRVAQQALTNVARHAAADSVAVSLSMARDAVVPTVSDDGQGFDPSATESGSTMGIRSMRERVEALGGTLEIDSAPEAGTRLTATVPRPTEPHEEVPGV
jgi:NarL family two-component system sensor histidine kinase LiaS